MPEQTSNSSLDKIPNVLSLFSKEPHPDDLPMILELRECKTPQEVDTCLKKYRFTKGGQNIISSTDFQNI